ncbi:unnamed protein product [Pleuronectes platessa]|uniref:Uncharacterized protein n=1 Tax=Pleuronectes platessa TaxID=8262 RepID=A0A9N7USL5_PLEPL|nr:unnamed protein product [Pleuronectes platessa]
MIRVDQHGRLMTPMMAAHNALMQQDTRRFSEASINPPPRPPPPNLKRLNIKSQRRPMIPLPGASRPTQLILPPPPQPPAQPPPQPQPGSNLAKMAHLARSTPQLDEVDNRERERTREREKSSHVQNTREGLIGQIMESVHGVTTEEVPGTLCELSNNSRSEP